MKIKQNNSESDLKVGDEIVMIKKRPWDVL